MIYTLSTSRRRGLFFTTREFESIPVSSTSSARGAPRIAPPEVLEVRTRRRPGDPSERDARHTLRSLSRLPPIGPSPLAHARDRLRDPPRRRARPPPARERRRGDPRVGGGTLPLLGTGRSTRAARCTGTNIHYTRGCFVFRTVDPSSSARARASRLGALSPRHIVSRGA